MRGEGSALGCRWERVHRLRRLLGSAPARPPPSGVIEATATGARDRHQLRRAYRERGRSWQSLIEAMPSMEIVRLVNSGTEPPCARLRVARGFTGRDLTVKFEGCYHGHVDSLLVRRAPAWRPSGIPDTVGCSRRIRRHDRCPALQFDSALEAIPHAWRPSRRDRRARGRQYGVCASASQDFWKACAKAPKSYGALLICRRGDDRLPRWPSAVHSSCYGMTVPTYRHSAR